MLKPVKKTSEVGSDKSNNQPKSYSGFQSPAADFTQSRISLDKELINNPDATFFARAIENVSDLNIERGDLLVIDRSCEIADAKIAVCFLNEELFIRKIKITDNSITFEPAPKKNAKKEDQDNSLTIWGIVTHVIKSV